MAMASSSRSRSCPWSCFYLVLALSLLVGVQGHVSHTHLSKDDRTVILVARPFGFGPNGVIEVEVSDDKIFLPENAPAANKAKIGFFITTAEAEAQLEVRHAFMLRFSWFGFWRFGAPMFAFWFFAFSSTAFPPSLGRRENALEKKGSLGDRRLPIISSKRKTKKKDKKRLTSSSFLTS